MLSCIKALRNLRVARTLVNRRPRPGQAVQVDPATSSASAHSVSCRSCFSSTSAPTTPSVDPNQSTPISENNNKDVITTPIFYVNAEPHLGHLYSALLCDARARWSRLRGRQVLFTTGTDEHGLKIEEAAERSDSDSPGAFCDKVAQSFVDCFQDFGISYDDFVRTTEPRHAKTVQAVWRLLQARGSIYLGTHRGWYCKSDESYLTDAQTMEVDPYATVTDDGEPTPGAGAVTGTAEPQRISLESGHPVEYFEEQNFMFRLSAFKEPLLEWLQRVLPTASVEPGLRRQEILNFVSAGLQDFSVSRPASRVKWGIPVPEDAASDVADGVLAGEDHMIYVWLDALSNYLTTTNALADFDLEALSKDPTAVANPGPDALWPADCQVVGKDILKFHAIYWPAFLLAAGLPLPRQIVAHGHWTMGGTKMSKSLGNVVRPADLRSNYGLDAVRYFLIRDGSLAYDADFSEALLVRRVNADLADSLGNLLSRCTAAKILPSGVISCNETDLRLGEREQTMLANLQALPQKVEELVNNGLQYPLVLQQVMCAVYACNAYFSDSAPWALRPRPDRGVEGDAVGLNTILYVTAETLRVCGLILHPIIPTTAETILTRIGSPDIPDIATSALFVGAENCPTNDSGSCAFAPLHERIDVDHIRVEQGLPPLFTKLSTPDGCS